jgi:peptidoglycan/LPS O-acetylase OafA/YrhL
MIGSLCFEWKIFEIKPEGRMLYIIINSIAWIPITAYIFFLLYPWFKPGSFIISKIIDRLIVWFCFHLSLLCMMYLMIETFRRYLDKTGKIPNELNRNSYNVYIIHVIVMGVIALVMLTTTIPSLLKYLILTVSTFIACNLIIYFYRKLIKEPYTNTVRQLTHTEIQFRVNT